MDLTFYSENPVAIKQIVDAGIRCGIVVTKNTRYKDTYTMTWDVDDYEHYATEVLTKPKTQKAFRERIEPMNGRFVMEREFELNDNGIVTYTYYSSCDDAGISHRLFNEVGVKLIHEEEYHQRSYDQIDKSEMEQEEVERMLYDDDPDDHENEYRDTEGYGGRFCAWTYGGYPAPRSHMSQDDVALSVENENDIANDAFNKLKKARCP